MAIELDSSNEPSLSRLPNDQIPREATFWCVNGVEADAATAKIIKDAPGSGKALYILSMLLTCDDDDATPSLLDDASTVLGPFYAKAAGPLVIDKKFERPIELTANKPLKLKAAAAGNISVLIEGYTANPS